MMISTEIATISRFCDALSPSQVAFHGKSGLVMYARRIGGFSRVVYCNKATIPQSCLDGVFPAGAFTNKHHQSTRPP